ncbi:MAG TPA: type II toxin-antitoxin system HicA family toxin [Thermoanaerobaculia bacterium]|nr:type II toxin-antitoxin system HicA family toxin [Thermoanaerobaculia bacterium]HQN08011.1 type II toxin-antitoxin system HicA family toxin [Thermoanaerobaculia bacterium]HQP87844.1 type II toxin-antitoxin system HicA family toxin [Thermoanaerobaculia bacterium]
MKRLDLIRHLERNGCTLLREEGAHSVFVNARERKASTVPRHREVNEVLCLKICKDLGVPAPSRRGDSR